MIKNSKILVIGDTIIDRNIFINATGLSLESPTIKGDFLSQLDLLGGAANLVSHLRILGCECTFVTSVSPDRNIDYNIINIYQEKENIKSRFWAKKGDSEYKLLQINDVNTKESSSVPEIDFNYYDIIAVSDYRCGLLNSNLINLIKKFPKKKFAASQVSDKNANFFLYEGFDEIVLNEKEYELLKTSFKKINVTLGDKGSMCVESGVEKFFPSYSTDVKNTIGAGDAFYAALLVTEDHDIANKWASYTVSKKVGEKLIFEECFTT